MPVIARHLKIAGRVQGVFYRKWTVDTARDLSLSGWVRNRVDGSVEALVEGEPEAVARFVALAHEGPARAKVARIDSADVAPEGFMGFDQRATG